MLYDSHPCSPLDNPHPLSRPTTTRLRTNLERMCLFGLDPVLGGLHHDYQWRAHQRPSYRRTA